MAAYVTVIGNITKDPEISQTSNGTTMCRFSIASNYFEKEKKVNYLNVTAWSSLAEHIGKYCKKGSSIIVNGELRTRQYEGNDGVKRLAVDIIATNFSFNSRGSSSDGDEESGEREAPAANSGRGGFGARRERNIPEQMKVFDDDGSDDSIPF